MTTSPTQPSSIKPVIVECNPDPIAQAITITIRWEISRQAIALHTPTPAGNAHTLILELTASQAASQLQTKWTLTDPTTNAQCALVHPSLANSSTDQITIERHDIKHDGNHDKYHANLVILNTAHTRAVIELDQSTILLLARTSLFGTLEIAGGRYKPLGARILNAHT